MLRSHFFSKALFGLLLLCAQTLANAQTIEQSIQKAQHLIAIDQLDSAALILKDIWQHPDPEIKIQALTELVRIATYQSDINKADSLVQIGDSLLKASSISLSQLLPYKISRGEFFRKNSQFQEALAEHQQVMRESQPLVDQPLILADALFYTGLSFERLSRYDSSLMYIDRAYAVYQEHLDSTDIKFANIYNGMGACYYRANRIAEAKNYYLKAAQIAEDKIGPDSRDLAIILSNLSSISRAEENYHEAIEHGEKALKIFKLLQDTNGEASVYYSLGVYHYFLGDYGRAQDYMKRCIEIRKGLFDKNHYSLIGPHEVLGIIYEEAGNYEQTLYYLKEARKKIIANFGVKDLTAGYNAENTAITFKILEQYDSALYYIQIANDILPRHLDPNAHALAVNQYNYADILYQSGQLNEAVQAVERSDKVFLTLGLEKSAEFAQNLTLTGFILADQGKWDEADKKFKLALEQIELNGDAPKEKPEYKLIPGSLSILNGYMSYLYQRYEASAEQKDLDLFEQYSDIYLNLSDEFRKQFIDPYTKSILVKDNAIIYDRNIGIFNTLYQKSGDTKYLQAAYKFSEYGRTCMLRDLQSEQISGYAGIPDSALQKESLLKQELARVNVLAIEYPDSAAVRKELFDAKEALNTYIDDIKERYPAYHELKYTTTVPELKDIQKRIKTGHQLIEYTQDDTAYYALLVNSEKADLFYLGKKDEINDDIRLWKEKIINRNSKIGQSGARLYQKLWAPFADQLLGERISIIPVGPLFYLNFETLPVREKFLIEDYNISYALSFTVLFSEKKGNTDGNIMTVVPGFEDEVKKRYQEALDEYDLPDEEFIRTIRQPWSLKFAEAMQQKYAPQSFTGLAATESNIKSRLHEGKILYFGTHAIADQNDPLRSRLILSKELGDQTEDGYLHAYELFGLPLNAELAVLSACESGLGKIEKGEGMVSLAYSLHYAGCPSTVMSLWKVDERINTQIAADFMEFLNEGLTKSEALRRAKLKYLEEARGPLRHPFYWGGMVLMGQDGKVEIEGNKDIVFWAIAVLLLLVLGLISYQIVSRKK